jgi:isochorismate hydrolase
MMKEAYWSKDTIGDEADGLLQTVMPWRQKHPFKLDPRHCALLVLDMQRFFLDPASRAYIPSAPAIIPLIRKLQQTFLYNHLPVFQTQHTSRS